MALHGIAHADMLPDGDAAYACWCGAWFTGPIQVAAEAYRNHMAEPMLPARTGAAS